MTAVYDEATLDRFSGLPTGPPLAAVLESLDPTTLDGQDTAAWMRAAFRVRNHADWLLLRTIREACSARADTTVRVDLDEFAPKIAAASLGWSASAATTRLDLAVGVLERMPALGERMRVGALELSKAASFVTGLDGLTDAQCRAVVAALLGEAPELPLGRLRDRILDAAYAIDPVWAANRLAAATAHARVATETAPSGAVNICGRDLPPELALQAKHRLRALAVAVQARLRAGGRKVALGFIEARLFVRLMDGTHAGADDTQIIDAVTTELLTTSEATPDDPDDDGPGDSGPDRRPDDSGPDGPGDGGPADGRPDGPTSESPDDEAPVSPGDEGDSGRDDSGPDDRGPDDSGPDDRGPDDSGPDDSGPDDSGPDDSGPDDSGPDDDRPDDDRPDGPTDEGPADEAPDSQGPDDQRPDDQGPDDQGPERPGDEGDDGPDGGGPDGGGPDDGGPDDGGPDDGRPHGPTDDGPEGCGDEGSGDEGYCGPAGSDPDDGDLNGSGPDGGPGDGGDGGPGECGPGDSAGPAAGSAPERRPGDGSVIFAPETAVRLQLSTLLGLDEHPGTFPGLGPVPAHTARNTALDHGAATWQILVHDEHGHLQHLLTLRAPPHAHHHRRHRRQTVQLTAPAALLHALSPSPEPSGQTTGGETTGGETSELEALTGMRCRLFDAATTTWLAHARQALVRSENADPEDHPATTTRDRDRRFPGRRLADWVTVRDQTCTAPGCTRLAEACDLDHTLDWLFGGRTEAGDLEALCRHDHRAKHEGGWTYEQPTPGCFVITDPTGSRHHTESRVVHPRPAPLTPGLGIAPDAPAPPARGDWTPRRTRDGRITPQARATAARLARRERELRGQPPSRYDHDPDF